MSRRVVLLEGGEGTGKSSIADWLVKEHDFKLVKLPTPGSDFEKVIWNKDKLPYELRVKAFAAVIDMIVESGRHKNCGRIVYDRGILSTCAYQSPELASEVLYSLDAMNTISEITDVVVLNVSPEVGLKREAVQNEVSLAGLEFHKQVNARFEMLGEAMQTVLRIRTAERILQADLPVEQLLIRYGTERDRELLENLGTKPTMLGWNWESLQTVSTIDTEKMGLNQVKNAIANSVGLPA